MPGQVARFDSEDRDAVKRVSQRARQENFPVAARLLSRRDREGLMAIYEVARLIDDVGDEAPGDRIALLDEVEVELHRAALGRSVDPTFERLSHVLRESGLGVDPFLRLIEANRVDQRTSHYRTFDDLVGYCMLSAAPVGELVLELFGASSPERVALSNDVCVALQLVEHLQDIGEDARRGRVYMPVEDMEFVGCTDAELLAPVAGPALRRLVSLEARRARDLLASGVALAARLPARPRVAVCGFVGGGVATLDVMRRGDYDVLSTKRSATKLGVVGRALGTLTRAIRLAS